LILLTTAFFLHLLLMAMQTAKIQQTPLLRSLFMDLSSLFLRTSSGAVYQVKHAWQNYFLLQHAREDNEFLKNRLAETERQLLLYQEKLKQAGRISLLEELQKALDTPAIQARIIGADASQWYNSRLLDKGKNAGITIDCAVLSTEGVLGRIVQVSATSSTLQLITDSESGVGVFLEGSRAQGVLRGEGGTSGSIDYIRSSEAVKVGERVLTSSLDKVYPKGLLAGVVSQVTTGRQLFQPIRVAIAAHPQNAEEVLVILKKTGE
jgi:rod shape-determining protein MreC